MKKIALAASILALSAAPALANTSSTAGTANATVVAPIALTHTSGAALNFGAFTIGASGGTVDITPGGSRSVTGTVTGVAGTVSADAFTVAGDPGRAFTISTSGADVANSAGQTMAFTTTPSATTGTLTGGASSFTVGGSLAVSSTQATGSYTGTYNATVAYN